MTKTSLLTLLGLTALSAAAQPTVTVQATMAPNFFGSPSFDAWAQNAETAAELGLSTYGAAGPTQFNAVSGPMPTAYNIATGFPSWLGTANPGAPFDQELGNRASFDVLVNGNGTKVSLADLAFNSFSSDSGNALGFSFGPGSDPFTDYDQYDIGLIFGPSGTTIVDSGDANQLVDAIVSVGAGDAYAAYADAGSPADEQALVDAAAAATGSYDYTGQFTIDGVTGSATAQFSAPDLGAPAMDALAIGGLFACGLIFKRKTN